MIGKYFQQVVVIQMQIFRITRKPVISFFSLLSVPPLKGYIEMTPPIKRIHRDDLFYLLIYTKHFAMSSTCLCHYLKYDYLSGTSVIFLI